MMGLENLLTKLLSEAGGAIIPAVVGVILTVSWARGQEGIRFRRLRKAFGRRITSHRDVAISVPLWIALENSRLAVRFAKRDHLGAEEVYYGPDEMFNRNDMFATASVINLFGDFFSRPVLYINDRDEPAWADKAVVIIGAPVANFHSRRFCEDVMSNPGLAFMPRLIEVPEDSVTGARTMITIPSQGLEFQSSNEKDYGAVLRFANPYREEGEFYVFVVAGIHADSTQEAGRILREHWRDFCGKGIGKALVFEMERGRQMTGRIVKRIGME